MVFAKGGYAAEYSDVEKFVSEAHKNPEILTAFKEATELWLEARDPQKLKYWHRTMGIWGLGQSQLEAHNAGKRVRECKDARRARGGLHARLLSVKDTSTKVRENKNDYQCHTKSNEPKGGAQDHPCIDGEGAHEALHSASVRKKIWSDTRHTWLKGYDMRCTLLSCALIKDDTVKTQTKTYQHWQHFILERTKVKGKQLYGVIVRETPDGETELMDDDVEAVEKQELIDEDADELRQGQVDAKFEHAAKGLDL
eukprot:6481376-Amphidinium_carterae.1